MADAYLTTSDVAVFRDNDMDLMVSDVLNDAPFLQVLAATTCPGNTYKYARETAAPAVGMRNANDGVENKKATREQVTVSLGIVDASFAVDVAVAKADVLGKEHAMAVEAMSHLKQAMFEVEQQILNGKVGNIAGAAGGFSGFADQTNLDENDDAMVIDATGTTAGTGSSVYLVRMGEGDVQCLWGQGGELEIGEESIIERAGSSTGRFPAYYRPICGWAGVKIGSTYSVARIANLTADSGKGLTDTLIYNALALFPASRQPNVIVMNRRSLKQLRAARTATNATGAPAPRPTEVEGIPIVVTDAISSTETLLST